MTDLNTTIRPTSDETAASAAAETTEAVLITEQQVLFATAAAVTPAKTRRWTDVFGAFAAAVRKAAGPPEPVRRERHVYLQIALEGREMDRL